MSRFLPSTTRLVATLAVACLLCAGLALPRAPRAEACSPGFFFNFEFFLEAETLDDLHDPEGPYAQDFAAYVERENRTAEDPPLTLPRITGMSLVYTVAEIHADVEIEGEQRPIAVFGGATTIRHAWGDVGNAQNPRAEGPRLDVNSCAFLNSLPDYGIDTWYMNRARAWPSWTQVPTPDVVAALTRLFGEPDSPGRDLAAEGRIIDELMANIEARDNVTQPVQPATWLNPAIGQVQPWDPAAAAQAPTPTFTG